MKFREANKVDRKSGGSPIKGLSFSLSCNRPRIIGSRANGLFLLRKAHTRSKLRFSSGNRGCGIPQASPSSLLRAIKRCSQGLERGCQKSLQPNLESKRLEEPVWKSWSW